MKGITTRITQLDDERDFDRTLKTEASIMRLKALGGDFDSTSPGRHPGEEEL